MKACILLIYFIGLWTTSFAQADSSDNYVFFNRCLEIPPRYAEGEKAMRKLFADNMRYPSKAEIEKIGGEVIVK